MKKFRSIIFNTVIFLCVAPAIMAQTNVVVLEDVTDVTVKDEVMVGINRHRSVEILNDKGSDCANFDTQCSKGDKLVSFSGSVTDKEGRVLRKIKKSDLHTTEYSREMATDAVTMFFDYTPPTYPIIVTYDWKEEISDGIIQYPMFFPQSDYGMEIKKASYRISVPVTIKCKYAERNTTSTVRCTTSSDGNNLYEVDMENLPAIGKEPYSQGFTQMAPMVLFAPSCFQYMGTSGSLDSWRDFGLWHSELLTGRDVLPDALRDELHQITDTCTSTKSKLSKVYDYLETHTRYVSIQLGIGGLQPASASDVCRTGFSDCKGLSNYMHAMLEAIGVPSFYTIISTRETKLLKDFPNQVQFNHAILQVPLPADTLWIECTDPSLPLGYVHSGIAGHEALVISGDGGNICRLPEYSDSSNLQKSDINIKLSSDGITVVKMNQKSYCRQYEDKCPLLTVDDNKKKEYIQNTVRLSSNEVDSIGISENKNAFSSPSISLKMKAESHSYANSVGDRLFVPVNPLLKSFSSQQLANRRSGDIYIGYGYLDEENITLTTPNGYTVESIPQPVNIQKPFGSFSSSIKCEGNKLLIRQCLLMRKGSYPQNLSDSLSGFLKSIASSYGQKIVLKK